ncbi:MFS transporter [Mesorhizobium sp. M9A.F.Ca.ET.002.03.1.2]|uniref:MFS transporter n=1 Tax=Mesorhizobium sp. M9A.F.Ca.ET.002.03.1.2 TaxID=2493668 RepID=UPI000F7650E1|nr:MFS transporter [Mesorhizobium sp. M9A.F.Ca.ET.002.03.1.2]AZO00603.1 MFS transporter [Mesorhizobium sp. M9A.F.Ca.ET.002.03.1.2]
MQLSKGVKWSTETAEQIYSGFNVVGRDGATSGAVVVAYPKDRLEAASQAMVSKVVRAALLIWVAFSVLSYLLLSLLLGTPQRRLARLEGVARGEPDAEIGTDGDLRTGGPGGFWRDLFGPQIRQLGANLAGARRQYDEASRELGAFASPAAEGRQAEGDDAVVATSPAPQTELASNPSRSLARQIASRLAPLAAMLMVSSALVLGIITLGNVNRSIEPELSARTNLIATVVGEDVQRALATGVPLDSLVSAENFFADMLKQLPEIAYVAVATGRVVLEVGERIDPYLAPPRERKGVRSHPIMHNGEEIAYVVIDVDPAFISKKFLDVFLDMGVVVVVAVLIAFEIMVLMSSRSLTAALDRLQRLAAMQAAGDFSKRAIVGARTAIDRAAQVLIERAEGLSAQFAAAWQGPGGSDVASGSDMGRTRLAALQARYGLSLNGPATLRFSYFTDLRLALFLFAAADELPLSFMPLYTRAAHNPFPWLSETVLISLPLAGYLLAIVLVSPFARPIARWLGPRRLLILAAAPTIAAHLWLYLASSVPEIVASRTILGVGYALVTLACQDYVIDNTPRDERDRSLGMFSTVLFGGIFCGTALGGVLADRLGQANVFLLSATFVLISALLIFSLVADTANRGDGTRAKAARPPLLASLRNWHFAALVFGIAIPGNVCLQAFISYLVALTLDSLGASPADIGRTLMVYFLAIALVGPLAGRAAERGIPVTAVALSGGILCGISLLTAAVWPSEIAIFLAVLGAGIGSGMVRGAQVSLSMSIAETELKHLGADPVLGALRTIERFASIAGLLLIAAVAGLYGYAMAIAVVAALALGGALLFGLSVLGKPAAPARQLAP